MIRWWVFLLAAQTTLAEKPHAELTPEAVVAIVVKALGNPNSPAPNAGIHTAYRFASPENRAMTGPYGRFLRIVKHPDFTALLRPDRDPAAVEMGAIAVGGGHAQQTVRVRSHGEWSMYKFTLRRQTNDPYRGVWMVDGVVPAPALAGFR